MTRYFDDVVVGQVIDLGSWRLEEQPMADFAATWDPQPFHIDAEAGARSIFGGLTASSLYVFAICTRLFYDLSEPFAILAMLGKDEVRLPGPARAGSTLRYETEVVETTPSRSKPDRGVIVLADRVTDEEGDVIMTQRVSLLLRRRSG